MSTSPYPPSGYPPFSAFPYPGVPGVAQVPGVPGVAQIPGIPPQVSPTGPTGPTGPTPSTPSSKLVYERTDLSMEEWRASLPKYRYQDFIADARVRNM